MQARKQEQYLARLDALAGLLQARLGDRPQGWHHPPGLEHVWREYASIRDGLIAEDRKLFENLPRCPEPPDAERDYAGYKVAGEQVKSFRAVSLTALRGAIGQARTLLIGGDSVDQLDVRERARLENENLRLKNRLLVLKVLAVLLPLLGTALGFIIRGYLPPPRP